MSGFLALVLIVAVIAAAIVLYPVAEGARQFLCAMAADLRAHENRPPRLPRT
ncbi:hypothetical protein J0H58_29500 [bacterium]|nr:hypothetical protein [bacterium]